MESKAVSVRSQVSTLIQRIGQATTRTLYVELELIRSQEANCDYADQDRPANTTSPRSKLSAPVLSSRQTWVQLLHEAVDLLPYCTDDEHGEILRLTSILLLAYLLPYSTGTDFYLLQNSRRKENGDAVLNTEDYILRMPLEDRLDQTPILALSSNEYSDEEFTLTDPDIDIAFDALLDAIALLLLKRKAHGQQVDLLHLLAMIVHPYHTPNSIPKFHPIFKKNPAVLKAIRLMENASVGLQFQIHYGHRRHVVDLIHRHVVLPEMCNEYAVGFGPLLAGALPHLRLSLRCFAMSARTKRDAHLALAASAHLAAQCRNYRLFLKPEWEFLLHLMVDDQADYECQGKCHCSTIQGKYTGAFLRFASDEDAGRLQPGAAIDRNFLCPHSSRGRLLSDFIVRSSRSRKDVDPLFLTMVTTSLTEAIEWQVDHWTQHTDEAVDPDVSKASKMHSTCLLASLLFAANHLFYLQSSEPSGDDMDDDNPYVSLIRCSIKLLRHSDRGIVFEAAGLLVQAFSKAQWNRVDRYSDLLLPTLPICIRDNQTGSLLLGLVAASACQSPSFATSMLKLIWTDIEMSKHSDIPEASDFQFGADRFHIVSYRLLALVSLNCPATTSHERERVVALIADTELTRESRIHAALSGLHSRLGRFFTDKNDSTSDQISKFLHTPALTNWERYSMGRNALVSGNFGVASQAFHKLSTCSLSEEHYVWMSVLDQVSCSEALLSKQGAMGIPQASVSLHSALSYMQHLGSTGTRWKGNATFQHRFILLRLDFLDIVTVLRQLAREVRLTGKSLSKHTRSVLHLRSVVRSLVTLASRYDELESFFGLFLRYSQSKESLGILRSLSLFLAYASKAVFSDLISRSMKKSFMEAKAKSQSHPVVSLMGKLDELLIQKIDAAVDPIVRAAALLEILDGMLMVPPPYPRDFFAPITVQSPELTIYADPARILDAGDEAMCVIETSPSLGFEFFVTCRVPDAVWKCIQVPVWTGLLWFRFKYTGRLAEDEDNIDNEEELVIDEVEMKDVRLPDISMLSPASTSVNPDGRICFAVDCPPMSDEGMYLLEVKLGCRDVNGRELEIPTPLDKSRFASIRVSRV